MGGLGLRRCEEHALGAYAASFFKAHNYLDEKWEVPGSISSFSRKQTQQASSQEIDLEKLGQLLETVNERSKKHLQQLQKPHANAWLTVVPSYIDGKYYVLQPEIFRTAVRRLLSIPVYRDGTTCTFAAEVRVISHDIIGFGI